MIIKQYKNVLSVLTRVDQIVFYFLNEYVRLQTLILECQNVFGCSWFSQVFKDTSSELIVTHDSCDKLDIIFDQIRSLDQQLTNSKKIVTAYKNQVVKLQLYIQDKDSKLQQAEETIEKLKQNSSSINTAGIENITKKVDSLAYTSSQKNSNQAKQQENSEDKFKQLLDEIKQLERRQNDSSMMQDNQVLLIDSAQAKGVIKEMNGEQQALVEKLLKQLKNEQEMRLQSEEQHDKILDQMTKSQANLEEKIKQLKDQLSKSSKEAQDEQEKPDSWLQTVSINLDRRDHGSEKLPKNARTGMLRVNLMEANLTHDCGTLAKMDPYVNFRCHNKTISSNIIKRGGLKPQWNQVFEFRLNLDNCQDQEWWIDCLDKDFSSSDLIGSCSVKTLDLCKPEGKNHAPGVDQWYELQYKSKDAGKLHIKSTWFPDEPQPDEPEEKPAIQNSSPPAAETEPPKTSEQENEGKEDAPAVTQSEEPPTADTTAVDNAPKEDEENA